MLRERRFEGFGSDDKYGGEARNVLKSNRVGSGGEWG